MVTYTIYLRGSSEPYYETKSSIDLEFAMQKLEDSKISYYVVS